MLALTVAMEEKEKSQSLKEKLLVSVAAKCHNDNFMHAKASIFVHQNELRPNLQLANRIESES